MRCNCRALGLRTPAPKKCPFTVEMTANLSLGARIHRQQFTGGNEKALEDMTKWNPQ